MINYGKIYVYKNDKLHSVKLVPEDLEAGDLLAYMIKLKEIYGKGTEVRATKKVNVTIL